MEEVAPALAKIDEVAPGEMGELGVGGEVAVTPFESPVKDYYLANTICRASPVMAECSQLYVGKEEAPGTDG